MNTRRAEGDQKNHRRRPRVYSPGAKYGFAFSKFVIVTGCPELRAVDSRRLSFPVRANRDYGDSSDDYSSTDRFGRIIDQIWADDSDTVLHEYK